VWSFEFVLVVLEGVDSNVTLVALALAVSENDDTGFQGDTGTGVGCVSIWDGSVVPFAAPGSRKEKN